MHRHRPALIWVIFCASVAAPVAISATSPLLAWREPVYIVAGFAGVVALALLLLQPLLASGALPGLPVRPGRRLHRWVGALLVAAVALHVGGLWVTSPPDVIDALTFTSATPFSAWGVIAMWAVFAAALLAVVRSGLRPRVWRLGHSVAVTVVVVATVLHAMLIEGTMGSVSKAVLCVLVLAATAKALADLRAWRLLRRRSG